MKEIKEDRQLKSLVKMGLLKQAPYGMVDRIMANVAVSPARRKLTIKAVGPKSYMATLMVSLMGALVIIAVYLQPETKFSFSIDQYINLHINPIWIAPAVVGTLLLWVYIIISDQQISKT